MESANGIKDKIYTYEYSDELKKEILGLEKIASAIIYDGKVDPYEVNILREWIQRNDEYLTEKPLSELKRIFSEITEDNIVTPDERETLLFFLDAIADNPSKLGLHLEIFDNPDNIIIERKTFCFTGKLVFSSIHKAQQIVVSNGGNYTAEFNDSVDFLVVGMLKSDAYSKKEYNDDIRNAISAKSAGSGIQIIREQDFVQLLMN
ncbi:MAG: BRCT domain-containing protein [Melioribacteraceae bacterium]|nr:BRCT domain-containing protein [Melioribacteraceae bacterium]MCF8265862.1 BRCT domain-containing protein [Melioribacteraceae bacterium]MCF8412446.1 BRCT domain-containing protein [Melioribacteraceae bacterium]